MEKLISFFRPWLEIEVSIPRKNLDEWKFAILKQQTNDPTIQTKETRTTGFLFHEKVRFKDPQTAWNLCEFYTQICNLRETDPFRKVTDPL